MIGYNPSHLNKNETLLEAFHRVEAYLKANPQYQVFQSSATYQEGTQEYALNTIVVPEGSSVGKGDVVLFSNVYYAVITAVSETTFSVNTATNFRGTTGATGANGTDGKDGITPNISMNATVDNNVGVPEVEVTKGGTNENPSFTLGFHNIKGATGDKGEPGLPALMYSKNVTTGPYSNFFTDLDGYNRTPQINDSCVYVSTNNDYLINGTIEQIFSDRQEASVHILARIHIVGREGPQGVGVKSITSGTPTVVNDKTNTPITITLTDNTTVDLVVSAENGKDGTSGSYNDLANIPVINQDLSASDFTPVANTYYRHTGTGGGTPAPVNPYIVNQDASNQYINTAIDPMSNIRQFVFDGQIGHMLGYNEDGIISDAIKMVKIADGHYQLQYTVDGETFQTMWDNTLPDPWTRLKQIGTLVRDKVYYWKSDMGNASMVENQNVWGAYISKDGQWTGGGSAYTTGVIYYYNGTGYVALDGSGSVVAV